MSPETELAELLAPTATHAERVRGLLELVDVPTLAEATGARASTLRNWRAGSGRPRRPAAIIVDDLRTVAKILLDNGVEPERITSWLTSRDPDFYEGMRPVDVIRHDPMDVFAAAYAVRDDVGLRRAQSTRGTTPARRAKRRSTSQAQLVPVTASDDS